MTSTHARALRAPGRLTALVALAVAASALAAPPAGAAPNPVCGTPLQLLNDCAPPDTTITAGPADGGSVAGAAVELRFTTAEPEGRATFRCRLDRGGTEVQGWADCTTPPLFLAGTSTGSVVYTGLAPGRYTFTVAASDARTLLGHSNEDPTPATRTFDVTAPEVPDQEAPDTRITVGPPRWLALSYLGVRYTSPEAGADLVGFLCHHNGREVSCGHDGGVGQVALLNLRPGDHELTVAAVDTAGAVDPTPAVVRWTVVRDDSALKRATRGWRIVEHDALLEDAATWTQKKGARLTLRAPSFRSAVLLVERGPGRGTVEVLLGKKRLARVSLSAPRVRRLQVVPLGSWSAARSGTLTVRVLTKGKKVVIDGLGTSPRR